MGNRGWPTLEEFQALQQLVNEGKVTAIAELIEKNGASIHRCVFGTTIYGGKSLKPQKRLKLKLARLGGQLIKKKTLFMSLDSID